MTPPNLAVGLPGQPCTTFLAAVTSFWGRLRAGVQQFPPAYKLCRADLPDSVKILPKVPIRLTI
ncbi:hypothetical protein J6590_037959 [Homalodisca vitripennis]|nr:hypothetical protein J6590_037959 [Homalodisca vitripennis]